MVKLSAEEKLEAFLRYLSGKESARTVAADIGVSHRYLLSKQIIKLLKNNKGI